MRIPNKIKRRFFELFPFFGQPPLFNSKQFRKFATLSEDNVEEIYQAIIHKIGESKWSGEILNQTYVGGGGVSRLGEGRKYQSDKSDEIARLEKADGMGGTILAHEITLCFKGFDIHINEGDTIRFHHSSNQILIERNINLYKDRRKNPREVIVLTKLK